MNGNSTLKTNTLPRLSNKSLYKVFKYPEHVPACTHRLNKSEYHMAMFMWISEWIACPLSQYYWPRSLLKQGDIRWQLLTVIQQFVTGWASVSLSSGHHSTLGRDLRGWYFLCAFAKWKMYQPKGINQLFFFLWHDAPNAEKGNLQNMHKKN